MQLTPRETERLLLFAAAELARKRLSAGVRLAHPEAVALAADEALERARAGAGYQEVREAVHGLFERAQLLPGVPELLEAPLQVEAVFDDGTRLIPLERLVRE